MVVCGGVYLGVYMWVVGGGGGKGYGEQGQVPGMHYHTCMRPRRRLVTLVQCIQGGGEDRTGYGKVCKGNRTGHPTGVNAVASMQRWQGFVTNVHWATLVTSGA